MRIIFDLILVLISIIFTAKSCLRIMKCKANSISDYVIVVVFIFNCLPVACDLLIGRPQYPTWLWGLTAAMEDDQASIIYDIYMIGVLITLKLYQYSHRRYLLDGERHNHIFEYNKKLSIVIGLAILSPIICLLITGNISNYLIYASTNDRNITDGFSRLMVMFYQISLFAFCYRIFGSPKGKYTTICLILYAFCLIWLSGKRYMVVTVLLAYLYCYVNCNWNKRKSITLLVLIGVTLFIIYTIYYVTRIKVMTTLEFESIYSQFRIDFGRDDVVKFVIKRELDNNPILEYRGKTLLSTIFMAIPRVIWVTKPYPHYRYLTATLYGLTPTTIPAGITPSIFEMLIANLWWFGIPIAYILLFLFMKISDKIRNIEKRMVLLLVAVGALTQSLDAMMIYFYYALFILIYKNIKVKRYRMDLCL